MKFRSVLFVGVLLLVSSISIATVIAISVVIDRAARATVRDNLQRSARVFAEMQTHHANMLAGEARVLADEPRLRAVLATTDITPETIRDIVLDLSDAVSFDMFLVTDAAGVSLVDMSRSISAQSSHGPLTAAEVGIDLGRRSLIANALDRGQASSIWIDGHHVYRAHAVRIAFGGDIVGVSAIGYLLDDETAQSVYRLTASSIVIGRQGRAIAWSSFSDGTPPLDDAATVQRLLSAGVDGEPEDIPLAVGRHLALARPFDSTDTSEGLTYVVLRSLDEALAPGRRLQRIMYITVATALPVALVLILWLSRRLTRPVDNLVAFSAKIGSGHLESRADLEGPLELRALATAMNRMTEQLDKSRSQLAAKERLEQEMHIAVDIQTSILPRALAVPGLQIAASMIPATEVGGDYYDVLPVEGGCWIAIGDVAGHGLTTGLVMMMVQNVLSSMVHAADADAMPNAVYCAANRILVENVRTRLQRDEHVTLTLFRYDGDAQFTFAGAHEDIIIWRADTGKCERIETPGTWLAVMLDIEEFTQNSTLRLEDGDVMLLYTDGVTEAMDANRQQFGLDRLCDALASVSDNPVEAICSHLLEEVQKWSPVFDDDVTLMVIRRNHMES